MEDSPAIRASEFPRGLDWVNTLAPVALADLAGRFVLVSFWTSSCVHCRHNAELMRRVQARHPFELALLGVHSPKFPGERDLAHLRSAVHQIGIEYPVVQDADHAVRQAWSVRAWPTVVIVDPEGRVIASIAGEIDADQLGDMLGVLIPTYEARGALVRAVPSEPPAVPRARTLAHPSKLLVTSGSTLFVADTGHHRILQLEVDDAHRSARIEREIGAATPGHVDGPVADARFRDPHGMALRGTTLYVADTGNHAVRAIDLDAGFVRTIAGTGVIGAGPVMDGGDPRAIALRSPWSLWLDPPRLFVSLAGSHQIVAIDDELDLRPFAGDGRQRLADGAAQQASFAQPSDLVGGGGALYVADAESSAIRRASLIGKPQVETLVGQGLFAWGDLDGFGPRARLQHPLGLALDGLLFVADTYNHRIKHMDVLSCQVAALAGTGERGFQDGGFTRARFRQPEGLAVRGRHLFVADTGNHVIRVCDLGSREVWTLTIAD